MGKSGVRLVIAAAAVFLGVLGLTGCGAAYQAYSDLDPEELELVVADTADWAHGRSCNGIEDCSVIEDLSGMSQAVWIPIEDAVSTSQESSLTDFTAARRVMGSRYDSTNGETRFTIASSRANEHVEEAVDRGLQLWVGMPNGRLGSESPRAFVLAFDTKGRIASIGDDSAKVLAEPIVKLSLAAGVSPLEYFLQEMVTEPPQRVLTTTNPGLPSETFGPKRMIANGACITFGPRGATLVFPDGTVKERPGYNVGVDVLDNWSDLDVLPFKRLLEPDARLEITGQKTTLSELDVAPAFGCPDVAIFVEEIRILAAA